MTDPAFTCTRCNQELTPDGVNHHDPVPSTWRQFENALSVDFSGGYGMFVDLCFDMDANDDQVYPGGLVATNLCHDCAVEFMWWMYGEVKDEFCGGHPCDGIHIDDIDKSEPPMVYLCCPYGWAPVNDNEGNWVGTYSYKRGLTMHKERE